MRFILSLALAFILCAASLPAHAESWSYDEEQTNQDEWATLDKDYAICENGNQQSPVQIAFTKKQKLPALIFHYGADEVKLQQKDYTLVVDIGGNHTIADNGKSYKLVQLRLHSPSEHTVQGHFWPLEIQLMHQADDGKMLILSVLAEAGQSNPALQELLDHAPDKTAISKATFNPQPLLPPKQGYYAYTGSLTIPPCTEGVEWRIFKEPISLSQKQLEAIDKITGRNARQPQPIYLRTITETDE